MSLITDHLSLVPERDLYFLANASTVRQSHHFNLQFDQTIDDALGVDRGTAIRTRAAHEASYRLLRALVIAAPSSLPRARLDQAARIFADMGHGRLSLDVSAQGGWATASALHYGIGWKRKYGRKLTRRYPADGFAAGYIAAAVEVAYDLAPGDLSCHQIGCLAMGADRAEFMVRRTGGRFDTLGLERDAANAAAPPPVAGMYEDRVTSLSEAVREVLLELDSDARGLCDEFGVLLTTHPADYYNHLTTRMLDIALTEKPQCLDVARELLAEAGQVGAFHVFGGLMASPIWPTIAGSAPAEPLDVIVGGLAIARALGYGRWALEGHVPGESLIVRSSGTHESIFGRALMRDGDTPFCHQFEGAVMALMQLAHRVSWNPPPLIGDDLYLERAKDKPWRARQTHCVARGDTMDRVVVLRV